MSDEKRNAHKEWVEKYKFRPGEERAKICGSLGGIKAKEERLKRKSLKEAFNAILESKDESGVSGVEKIALSAFHRACDGDPQAIKLFAQIVGEYSEKVEIAPSPELPQLTVQDLEELKTLVKDNEEK